MYILVIIAVFCAAINNIFLHVLSKVDRENNPYLVNAIISTVWVVGLLAYNKGWQGATNYTIICGLIYGLVLAGFIFFKTMAMSTGPIALTTLIGCGGFVITTVFNAIYWKEKVDVFEIVGIILMLIAVLMINYTPRSREEKHKEKTSLKWKIYCLMFFIFSAATGIVFRFHQSLDKANTDEMMIFASGVATVILLVIFFIGLAVGKKENVSNTSVSFENRQGSKKKWWGILIAVICGIFSCVYNRLNIYNTGVLPNALFFPIFNGGVVIVSFLSGWLLFKEKPTKTHFIGVALGFLALLSFSRFFGLV